MSFNSGIEAARIILSNNNNDDDMTIYKDM